MDAYFLQVASRAGAQSQVTAAQRVGQPKSKEGAKPVYAFFASTDALLRVRWS